MFLQVPGGAVWLGSVDRQMDRAPESQGNTNSRCWGLEQLSTTPSSSSPSVGLCFFPLPTLFCSLLGRFNTLFPFCQAISISCPYPGPPHCHFFSACLGNSCISDFSQVVNIFFLFFFVLICLFLCLGLGVVCFWWGFQPFGLVFFSVAGTEAAQCVPPPAHHVPGGMGILG